MEGGAAAHVRQDLAHPLVVGDQQVAGRGAHEDLDPAAARQALQIGQMLGVLVRAADVEGVVRPHPVVGPHQLVGHGLGIGRVGIGVRHLEHGDDAAQGRRAAAGLEVFLPLQTRLAEVDLGVDDARQDRQAGGVEHLARRGLTQIADEGDAAVDDADVGLAASGVVGDFAAPHDQVIGLGHWRIS
ncbi:hypothetical protein D3C80_1561810 [compost metagenome]